jgi:type I restriction-modification system DNA methylase subunit
LAKSKEENLPGIMRAIWDLVLSVHPKTKNIFHPNKGFDIKRQATYKKLIDKLAETKFEDYESDIQGDAYQEVIKDIMTGKVLGQFFTPPLMKNIMVDLVNPQVKEDGTIETIFDPAMGTGGFLISSMRHLTKQAEEKGIKLDMKFVSEQGLGGREAEPDTYQLARSNMLISSGYLFDVLECGDSIRNPINRKYDIIFANPPFGIKGLMYDEIIHSDKFRYLPIKTNSAIPLFLQAIISMLKCKGRCAIVLPNGQELFGRNKALTLLREYLMRTCDLKEVIHIPSGVFTHTSIKTCIFYFVKKYSTKILNVDRVGKTPKYTFEEGYLATSEVSFYDYLEEKTLLCTVGIDKIIEKGWSLNYSEYVKKVIYVIPSGYEMKKLGEICEIQQGKLLNKDKIVDGNYSIIGGGKIIGTCDIYNRNDNEIVLTRVGDIHVTYMLHEYYLTDNGFSILSKLQNCLTKYIYYHLNNNKHILESYYNGTAQKVISKTSLENIEIPIPHIDRQKEIVQNLEFLDKCIKDNKTIIENYNKLNKMFLNKHKDYETKPLGEICEFSGGKQLSKDNFIKGDYPVIGGGTSPVGYHNEFNKNENTILCSSSGANAGYISMYETKVWASDCFSIEPNDLALNNYIYYYFKNVQHKIYELQNGTAQPHVYSNNIKPIKIPIPPLETQQKIVNYFDKNNNKIKQLEEEIEEYKTQSKEVITTM